MRNLWDVLHKIVDGDPLTDAEKAQAHGLIDVHLAQHGGIAAELGEHREKLREHAGKLAGLGGAPDSQ